jgi:hypothetical protein
LGYQAQLKMVPHVGSTWRPNRQAGVGGWGADYPSASTFFSNFTCGGYDLAHPDENLNTTGLCDKALDAEVARARALQTTDPPAASSLWRTIDRQVTDQGVWVVIRSEIDSELVSRRTGNYTYCWLAATSGSTSACLDQLWVR